MEKIWILILVLLLSGCVPAIGQDKCFTPDQQRVLLDELDRGRTCDTLLKNREQKIDSLFLVIGKKNDIIFLHSEKERILNLTVNNLQESVIVLEEEINALNRELSREIRRKKFYKICTFILLPTLGIYFLT